MRTTFQNFICIPTYELLKNIPRLGLFKINLQWYWISLADNFFNLVHILEVNNKIYKSNADSEVARIQLKNITLYKLGIWTLEIFKELKIDVIET